MVEKSGVEKFLLALGLKSSWLKSSWLKSLGLKGLRLKLRVEKSGLEMSFNPRLTLFKEFLCRENLITFDISNTTYHIVASTSPSCLEAHASIFRSSMKGKCLFTVTCWRKVDFYTIKMR